MFADVVIDDGKKISFKHYDNVCMVIEDTGNNQIRIILDHEQVYLPRNTKITVSGTKL